MTEEPGCTGEEGAPLAEMGGAHLTGPRPPAALAWDILVNWVGHVIFMIGGFVLPRLLDHELGQGALGVWDFGWSTVAYFSLLNAGIASSVNRFVARYRAMKEWAALNAAVSSCACIFLGTAVLAVIATISLTVALPSIIPETFIPYLRETQALTLYLGLASAVSLFIPVYNGVITGHQRYDLVMYIESGTHVLLLGGILIALWNDGGLPSLGMLVLASRVLEGAVKLLVARRVCPRLRVSARFVTKRCLREVAAFGGKTFIQSMSQLLLYQGNSLLIGINLGPAVLAVHARSMGLLINANKILYQFGRVLVPSASIMQAREDDAAIERLVLQGGRFASLIAFPIAAVLMILGSTLLRIWMGEDYAQLPLLLILAVGHMAAHTQIAAYYTLAGLNRHGIPGLAGMGTALISLSVSLVWLGQFGGGLVAVAVGMSVALALTHLIVIPYVVCREIGISVRSYFAQTIPSALLSVVPFSACLMAARVVFAPDDYLVLGVGLVVGGPVLLACYWRSAIPSVLKDTIRSRWSALLPWGSSS